MCHKNNCAPGSAVVPLWVCKNMDTVLQELFARTLKTANGNHDMIPQDYLLCDLMELLPTSTVFDALDLIDRRAVTKSHCPSGRTVFQIDGKAGKSYQCFASSVFCTCPSYVFAVYHSLPYTFLYVNEVLRRGGQLMCKHVLAARIADCLKLYVSTEVSDHAMSAQLQQMTDSQGQRRENG